LWYRVKGSHQHREAVEKLGGCGPVEDVKVCGIKRTESLVMGPRTQTLGRGGPISMGKVKFGDAEEVDFGLAWPRGERSSGG
jgi:hypothetical protein